MNHEEIIKTLEQELRHADSIVLLSVRQADYAENAAHRNTIASELESARMEHNYRKGE
jgi:hypothetical protein